MRKSILLFIAFLCVGIMTNAQQTVYQQNFSTNPGFYSYSDKAYWDQANGNYFVNTYDNCNQKYWASSPSFTTVAASSESFEISFDIVWENPDFGTYPSLYLFDATPTCHECFTDCSNPVMRFYLCMAGACTTYQGIKVESYYPTMKEFLTTSVAAANTWYNINFKYNALTKKIDFVVKKVSDNSVMYQTLGVAGEISSSFRWLAIGFNSGPNYGSVWSPMRVDNILIKKTPLFSAGIDITTCQPTATLNASNTAPYNGTWSVASNGGTGTFANISLYNTSVSNLTVGNNKYVWTVNENGTIKRDTVLVNYTGATFAGNDLELNDDTLKLTATPIAGFWTTVQGTAKVDNSTNANTTARNFSYGMNVLKWKNNACNISDEVSITYNPWFKTEYQNLDDNLIPKAWTLNKSHIIANQGGAIISGGKFITNPIDHSGELDRYGKMPENVDSIVVEWVGNYAYTQWHLGVHFIFKTIDGYSGQFGVYSGYSNSNNVIQSWITKSNVTVGNSYKPSTLSYGIHKNKVILKNDYFYYKAYNLSNSSLVFETTQSLGTFPNFNISNINKFIFHVYTSTDNSAYIDSFSIKLYPKSFTKSICTNTYQMNATNPTPYNGVWSVISGAGTFANISQYNSLVSNISSGTNKYVWLVNKNGNVTRDTFTIINNSPNILPFTLSNICTDTTTVSPQVQNATTYLWSNGSNTLKTKFTNLAKGQNAFTLTATNSGCSTSSQIQIYFYPIANTDANFTPTVNNLNVTLQPTASLSTSVYNAKWSMGDGNFYTSPSFLRSFSHSFANANYYEICQTVSNLYNCPQVTSCQNILVGNPNEKPMCKAVFTFNISDLSVQYTDQSLLQSTTGVNFQWTFGDNTFSTQKNPAKTYLQSGYYTVSLKVTDPAKNCTDEISTIVELKNQTPIVSNVANFDFVVTGSNIALTNNSLGTYTDIVVDFGDGTIETYSVNSVNSINHNYTKDGFYNICVTVFDNISKQQSTTCEVAKVSTSVLPKADFSFSVDTITNKIIISDKSIGSISQWFIDYGDGTLVSFSSYNSDLSTHTYTKSGTYNTCLMIKDINNLISEQCQEIQIVNKLSSQYNTDFSYFAQVLTVNFMDKSNGTATKMYWTFGDGEYSTTNNPTHVYTQAGIYNVCLSGYNSAGVYSKTCKDLVISTPCKVVADYIYFVDDKNKTINLSDKCKGNIHKYYWVLPDGTTSTKNKLNYKYGTEGVLKITLMVWDTLNNCSDFKEQIIQTTQVACMAMFDYKVDAVNQSVDFVNKSIGSDLDYFWDFADSKSSFDVNPSHVYQNSGFYKVNLTVRKKDGSCMHDVETELQIGKGNCRSRYAAFIDSATNNVQFISKQIGVSTHQNWIFGDGQSTSNKDPKHPYTKPGYYNTGLNIYNVNTGCMDNYGVTILVRHEGNDCEAEFNYVVKDSVLTLQDKSKGKGLSYFWNFGDGTTSTLQNPPAKTFKTGTYTVCLKITKGAISNLTCENITIKSAPKADFNYTTDYDNKKIYCQDKSNGNVKEVKYTPGNAASVVDKNPNFTFVQTTPILMKQEVTDQNNIVHVTAKSIKTDKNDNKLNVDFVSNQKKSNLKGKGYPVDMVGATFSKAPRVVWDFGDGTKDSTTINPSHVYAQAGTYNVCVTISDPVTGLSETKCNQLTVIEQSINEYELGNSLVRIYPNPVQNTLYVEIDKIMNDTEISVYSITGQLQQTKQLKNTKNEIDISRLQNGTYVLKIVNSKGIVTQKIVKQ